MNRYLSVVIFPTILFVSCRTQDFRPVLRVEVNEKAWIQQVQGSPGAYGGWDTPSFSEYTWSESFSNALRQSFVNSGIAPDTRVNFRWEETAWTNAVLFLSTSHHNPDQVTQAASNAFTGWLKRAGLGKAIHVRAPSVVRQKLVNGGTNSATKAFKSGND